MKTINGYWTRSSQKVIHKADGFIGSKIADAVTVIVFRNKKLLKEMMLLKKEIKI